jgi:hypothetical protein
VDGTLRITVVEWDPWGNHDQATSAFTKETVGPALAASASATTVDAAGALSIAWTTSDASGVASVRAVLDGQTAVLPGSVDVLLLTSGAHAVTVTSTDVYGNTTTSTLSFKVVVTAPGLKTALQAGIARGWVPSSALQATLLSQVQAVVDAASKNGNAASNRLWTFMATVYSAPTTQISASFRALLLDWAFDLYARL